MHKRMLMTAWTACDTHGWRKTTMRTFVPQSPPPPRLFRPLLYTKEADLASVSLLQILRQQQKKGAYLPGAIAARARLPGLPRPTQNARSKTLFVRLMIGLPNHHRLNLHRLSRCPLRENVSWV